MIGNTLLDMVDPQRHVHPGIPYDFYSGYIVVESSETSLAQQPTDYYGNPTDKTLVIGDLSIAAKNKLQEQYGKFDQVIRLRQFYCNFLNSNF